MFFVFFCSVGRTADEGPSELRTGNPHCVSEQEQDAGAGAEGQRTQRARRTRRTQKVAAAAEGG